MGILFAFIALFCWGLGDFLIQKSTREFGKWSALFFITATASILLFGFVYKDIVSVLLSNKTAAILFVTSIVILFAALFDFQALKDGKISVVEPIYALEIPITALLASMLIAEHLTVGQTFLVLCLIVGIFLVSTESLHHLKNIKLERGVVFAFLGAIGMGTSNFLFGVGSREINPLMINWFTSFFMVIVCLAYLIYNNLHHEIFRDWRLDKKLIIGVGIIDNAAWIAYSYSTLHIPIAIATGISEAYIAMAAILGLFFNKEKLQKHQYVGLIIAVFAAITLAFITEG